MLRLHKKDIATLLQKILILTLIWILLIFIISCQYSNMPQQILIKTDTFTLVWDPPDFDARTIINPIEFYRIYYRELGYVGWNMIAQISGDEKIEYTVHFSDFGNGMYEFAVDYVQYNGQTSQLHSSCDHTAMPIGGWYILWLGLD